MSGVVSIFSIIIKPEVGNSVASVKVIVVAESLMFPFNVVVNSKVQAPVPSDAIMIPRNLIGAAIIAEAPAAASDLVACMSVLAAIYPPIKRVICFANTQQLGYLHHYLIVVI